MAFFLFAIDANGQTKKSKNPCGCPPVVVHKKKKHTINTPIVKTEVPQRHEAPSNGINIVNNNTMITNIVVVTDRDTPKAVVSKEQFDYEPYIGVPIIDKSDVGFLIGFNMMSNGFLVGLEYSKFKDQTSYILQKDQTTVLGEDCGCGSSQFGFNSNKVFKYTKSIEGMSLNVGYMIINNVILTSGFTRYTNVLSIDNEKLVEYDKFLMNVGVKYRLNMRSMTIYPTFSINKEVISASLGLKI